MVGGYSCIREEKRQMTFIHFLGYKRVSVSIIAIIKIWLHNMHGGYWIWPDNTQKHWERRTSQLLCKHQSSLLSPPGWWTGCKYEYKQDQTNSQDPKSQTEIAIE